MFDLNDVLNRTDLVSYVERAGAKLHKSANRYSCACPLHGGDNENAFSVYYDTGKWKWHCFSGDCGTGDAISFVGLWMYGNETDPKQRFKLACEWIMGANINDVPAMYKSAEERLEEARLDEIAARERKEARLKELQVAEKHLLYHRNRGQWARDMWAKRGLDEGMQDFFTLGACDDFTYWVEDAEYHSPTLSIPYFGENLETLFIQHRLVNPVNLKDKYRPEKMGIDIPPYLAVPGMGYYGDLIIVVEGAIKSMVTWSRLTGMDIQVIGSPTQSGYIHLIEPLKGKHPIIIPDPKGNTTNKKVLQKPYELARQTGGSVLDIPVKIDDYILETDMTADNLLKLVKQARKA